MEQNVGLFAMDRDVRGASLCNRIWGSSDVLVARIFRVRLRGIGFDPGISTQIGVGYGQLRIFNRFHKIGIDILNLNLFLCCGIMDRFPGTLLARVCWFVWFCIAFGMGCICFAFFIKPLISLPLVFVEILDECLDIGDLVLS